MLYKIRNLLRNIVFIKYLKNTSWLMIEQIIRLIAGLFIGVWVARYLEPQKFGILSYSLAFTALFSGLAKLGLDNIVIRELISKPNLKIIILGTAFRLKLIGGTLTFIIISIISSYISEDYNSHIYIMIISGGFIFQSLEVIDFYYQSKVLSKFVSLSKFLQLIISSFLKLYAIYYQKDLIWFIVIILLDQIILYLIYSVIFFKTDKILFIKSFDLFFAKKLLKDSWPLILSSLMVVLYMKIDQIMIRNILGDLEVGLYSVAIRLTEIPFFIPLIITNSFFPAIISVRSDKTKSLKRLQMMYDLLAFIAIFIGFLFTIFSKFIINTLYGVSYIESHSVLIISCWSGIFIFLGIANSKWLIIDGYSKYVFLKNTVGCIANIILNFLLIPKFGIIGASIASIFSYAIVNVFFLLIIKSLRYQFIMIIKSIFLYNYILFIWNKFINILPNAKS